MVSVAAVVIVQIVPPAPVEHLGERLISACTQGLRRGACVLSTQSDAVQRSTLAAEVHWDEGFRVATIRVLKQGSAESEGMSGKIVFDDDDAIEDRWTTAGFTIATLVGDLSPSTEQRAVMPPPGERPPRERVLPRPSPSSEVVGPPSAEGRFTLRTAGGVAVGQGMHDHAFRAGPWATLSLSPLQLPAALLLRGAVAWAFANSVNVRWSTVAVGMETRWPDDASRVGAVLAADVGVSHIVASAERTASRAAVALSLFAGGEIALAGPVGLAAGARVDAGPTTQLATSEGLIVDRRLKFGGSIGVVVKL